MNVNRPVRREGIWAGDDSFSVGSLIRGRGYRNAPTVDSTRRRAEAEKNAENTKKSRAQRGRRARSKQVRRTEGLSLCHRCHNGPCCRGRAFRPSPARERRIGSPWPDMGVLRPCDADSSTLRDKGGVIHSNPFLGPVSGLATNGTDLGQEFWIHSLRCSTILCDRSQRRSKSHVNGNLSRFAVPRLRSGAKQASGRSGT